MPANNNTDNLDLAKDAIVIIDRVIKANEPGAKVREAIKRHKFSKNIYLSAIGKAAWTMASAAYGELGSKVKRGIVITKYNHSQGDIPGIEVIEAGHPLSDENTLAATQKIVDMAQSLGEDDELVFLISGGGSALFELPLNGLSLKEIIDVNNQLLSCGADIVEINKIRKRLSSVKAGRFAQICSPAKIFNIVMSDVLGDRLDSIASGPTAPDNSTVEETLDIVQKYKLSLSKTALECLNIETPKSVKNTETEFIGNVLALCSCTAEIAAELGYTPYVMCTEMNCEAREAGRMISAIAKQINQSDYSYKSPCAIIFGGETVVTLKGSGKGGRNQELALSSAEGIACMDNIIIFSFGSDGTDGPTDAAGGIVNGATYAKLNEIGLNYNGILDNNDSYNALKAIDGLIMTGPTGININDVAVILCK